MRQNGQPSLGRVPEEPEAPGIRRGVSTLVPLPKAVLLPRGQFPELRMLRGSVLKRNADEIALPPDHAALANGVKIVKTQLEIQRQQIEGVEFDTGAGIGDVLNAASEDTALRVKEQQRVFRDRRPRY